MTGAVIRSSALLTSESSYPLNQAVEPKASENVVVKQAAGDRMLFAPRVMNLVTGQWWLSVSVLISADHKLLLYLQQISPSHSQVRWLPDGGLRSATQPVR